MKTIKDGSKWISTDHKEFYVLSTVELEGHLWVHYKSVKEEKEYSCYAESFLARFSEIVN